MLKLRLSNVRGRTLEINVWELVILNTVGHPWPPLCSTDINYSSKHYKWIRTSAVEIIKYFITFQHKGPTHIWTCRILALWTEECPWVWMYNHASVQAGAKIWVGSDARRHYGHQGEDQTHSGPSSSALGDIRQHVQVKLYLLQATSYLCFNSSRDNFFSRFYWEFSWNPPSRMP